MISKTPSLGNSWYRSRRYGLAAIRVPVTQPFSTPPVDPSEDLEKARWQGVFLAQFDHNSFLFASQRSLLISPNSGDQDSRVRSLLRGYSSHCTGWTRCFSEMYVFVDLRCLMQTLLRLPTKILLSVPDSIRILLHILVCFWFFALPIAVSRA